MLTLREYKMRGDGIQAPGAIVLRHRDDGFHPYVVHFRNDQVGGYCNGAYCKTFDEALQEFADKCRRYDPTGRLKIGA